MKNQEQIDKLYKDMEAEDAQINKEYWIDKTISSEECIKRLNELTKRYVKDLKDLLSKKQNENKDLAGIGNNVV